MFHNKKVLLVTTALTLAGQAFAVDVSGKVELGYKKDGDVKGFHNDSSVAFSGSKTTSSGLTFGGSYTIKFDGDDAKTSATVAEQSGVKATNSIVAQSAGKSQTAEVSSYVSGSFGKVTMGKHNVASKSHGIGATNVGSGADTQYSRVNTSKGVTYSSPSFNGISGAYTTTFGDNKQTAYAVKYDGKFSGVGVTAAYGVYKDAEKATNDGTGYGVKLSKGAFAASYGIDKQKEGKEEKATRIGVQYSAGKVTISYAQNKVADVDAKKQHRIKASYTVASGLEVFAQQTKGDADKNSDKKTTIIGTAISF